MFTESCIELVFAGLLRDAPYKDLLGPLVVLAAATATAAAAAAHSSLGPGASGIAGLGVQLVKG